MKCVMPKSFEELSRALAQCTASSAVIAGGTDYIIRLRSGIEKPDMLIYLGQIPELNEITLSESCLRIGAMVTMTALAAALKEDTEFGALADAASGIGSPQIRNKATVAGNICNASPAGDMLPVCWLYDAQIELLSHDGSTEVMPIQQFILGPNKTALRSKQVVTAIVIQRRKHGRTIGAFKKLGYRSHVSIARESMAALLVFDDDGIINEARIVLGAVANTPVTVSEAEKILCGNKLTADSVEYLWPIVAKTIHDNCREANRLYKTEAAHGLVADILESMSVRKE